MFKKCIHCGEIKALDCFYAHPSTRDRYDTKRKVCVKSRRKKHVRIHKEKIADYDRHRQRNNFHRLFYQRYRMMSQRTAGTERIFGATGKAILPLQDFLDWCRQPSTMKVFYPMWVDWVKGGYTSNLTPSIDRIDNNRGYELDNYNG